MNVKSIYTIAVVLLMSVMAIPVYGQTFTPNKRLYSINELNLDSIRFTTSTHWINGVYGNNYELSPKLLRSWILASAGSGTVTSITAGSGLSGGVITSSGTISLPDVITAGSYGSATQVPVLTIDAKGRITGVTPTTITGDNWGSQVIQSTSRFSGDGTPGSPLELASQGAVNGQVLTYVGGFWVPQNPGTGADNWGSQVVITDATLTGTGITGNTLKIAQQGATSGQVLKWDGSTWLPAADNNSGGTVTSVAGTSPIFSSGGATPTITIQNASTTNTGALTNTDWNTFNGKENVLTFNAPLTRSVNAISIATANTTTTGVLSSTDWNTFNNKQSTLVSGTSIKTIESISLLGSGNIDLTKSDVGLANVDNTSDLNKPISTATQSALDLKDAIITFNAPLSRTLNAVSIVTANTTTTGALSSTDWNTFNGKQSALISGTNIKTIESISLLGSGNIDLSKSDVGLANVDNTSDLNKPISTATQTALDAKQATLVSGTNIKTVNGTTLLGSGNISTTQDLSGLIPYTGATANVDLGIRTIVASNLSGTNTGDNAVNSLYSGLVSNATHTGDATGATVLTLATVNSNVGSYGSPTSVPTITVNAKGLVTAASATSIPIATNLVTGLLSSADWTTFNSKGSGTVTSVIAGTGLSGGTITGSGTISLPDVGTPSTYGSATQVPVFTTDAQGRVTGVTNTTITAPGDNWGSSVVNTTARFSGNGTAGSPLELASQSAVTGQILTWSGTAWVPQNAGSGADNWGSQVAQTNATLTGDGTVGTPLGLAQQSATSGQVLKWSGSAWAPAADNNSGGTVTSTSIVTANGISGSVATATTTPAITLTLGAITPTSVNSVVLSGSATPTLAVTGTSAISGTNTGDNAVNSLYSGLISNATHTGDATGSTVLTLATVNSNVGSFGNSTTVPNFTVNAKGLITAAGSTAIPTATNLVTGLLSSTDWTTFNNKGSGTVTSVSVTTANGVSGSVATSTSTPAITLTLGAITPTSVVASGNVSGLNLSGTNTGDQTSIVGITGTKAQFNTALTDGDFLYVGDISAYTDELAQDAIGAMVDGTLVYTDATPLLSRAALTGAITASAGSNSTSLGSFTTAQLNTALSDNDIATGGGTATGTNTGDNAVNSLYSGLVSNATHTGDATGATALTVVGIRGVALPTLGVSAGSLRYTGTGTNTWVFDNNTYLTANQTITLSGHVTGSGTTAITTTIGTGVVTNTMLAGSIDLTTKVTGLLPDGNISSAATWNAKQAALSGTGLVKSTTGTITYITDNSSDWNTAFTDRNKWDGGATGLTASTGRTSLGATTVGSNFFTLTNPTAVTFPRINADNTVSALDAATFRTAIGAGTGGGSVTSVAALTLGTTGTDLSSSVATGTTTPVITLNVPTASATNRGALSSADWSTFNGKESALTFSAPLSRSVNTISMPVATTSVNGYLSSTDWNTFNNKGSGTVTSVSVTTANGVSGSVATSTSTPAITLTLGAITPTSVNSVVISGSTTPTLAVTGTSSISGSNTGDNAVNSLYSGLVSNATHTGDATGATALTVVGINGTLLSGLTTGLLKNTTTTGVPTIAVAGTDYLTPTGSAAGLTSFPTLNQNTTGSAATLTTGRTIGITGDATWTSPSFNGSSNVTAALTLATVNSNVGSFGTSTSVPTITVNAKGLVTAASATAIPTASTSVTGLLTSTDWNTFNNKGNGTVTSVTGTTNRITSSGGATPVIDISASYVGQASITTLGTIGTGVWQGTAIGDTYISSATNWNAAFNTRIQSGTLASRPAFGTAGRNYYATDNGIEYYDTGSAWVIKSGAFTGDITTPANSLVTTLATVNSNVGSFGSATQVPSYTVNAKGLITAASNITITPAASSITGGAALTKVDDTNVTLTLGGSPTTALLSATSITVGWTGTLADGRIASAATWNAKESALTFSAPLSRSVNTISIPAATTSVSGHLTSTDWNTFNNKQPQLNGTGFVKATGTTISYDNSTYMTGSGTTNTIPVWSSSTGLGNSLLTQTANSLSIAGYMNLSINPVYSGTGSATTGAPRMTLATGTITNDDAAILLGRKIVGTSLFSHGIRDESEFTTATTGAYASFDASPTINGTDHMNHVNGHQTRIIFNNSGGVDALFGHTSLMTNNGGTVTNTYNYHVANPVGTGVQSEFIGYFMEPITNGAVASSWFLYSAGTSPSYIAGQLQLGTPGLVSTGPVRSSNIWTDASLNAAGVGIGTPLFSSSGFYLSLFGHNSGSNLAANTTLFNSFFGASSGYSATTGSNNTYIGAYAGYTGNGSGNIYLGKQAGFWETGSNKLIIDNEQRTDEATQRTSALLYGVMSSTVANQTLTINGKLNTTNRSSTPTGVAGFTSTGILGDMSISSELTIASGTLKLAQQSATTNQVLGWSGSAWVPQTVAGGSGTVTSVAALTLGTTGTDLSSSVANSTTTPVITLNVPTASATNRGVLSSADWTTFNNKGNGTVTSASIVTANGISGSVATATTTPAITLTLGAITPTSVNSVVLSGSSTPTLAVTGTSSISGSNTGDNAVNSLYSGLVSNATHTGDATGSTVLTLATVNSNVGTFGSTTQSPVITVDAKGRITAVSNATIAGGGGGWTDGGTTMYQTTLTDAVGIGTSTPISLFTLAGTASYKGAYQYLTGNTTLTVSNAYHEFASNASNRIITLANLSGSSGESRYVTLHNRDIYNFIIVKGVGSLPAQHSIPPLGSRTYIWNDYQTAWLPTDNKQDVSVSMILDGGGSAITTGIKGDMEIPYDGTITEARLLCDQTGSIVVDLWKDTYANYPPVVADAICASAKLTISSALKDQKSFYLSTLTGWTTNVTRGDIIRVNVDSASTVTRCTLSITLAKL